jgi:hypothetical protein
MATASFTRTIVIRDKDSISKIKDSLRFDENKTDIRPIREKRNIKTTSEDLIESIVKNHK